MGGGGGGGGGIPIHPNLNTAYKNTARLSLENLTVAYMNKHIKKAEMIITLVPPVTVFKYLSNVV